MFSFLRPASLDGVGVAFTDRWGGSSASSMGPLNLGRGEVEDPEVLRANFDAVRQRLEFGPVVALHQVHGADVLSVDESFLDAWSPAHHLGPPSGQPALPQADAMVTTVAHVALCIRVADCVPVAFADPERRVIGAAHAGRAGFVAGIIPATVAAMRRAGAQKISAWIGPHICGACYEVPEEMRAEVAVDHPAAHATTRWGTPALDIGAGILTQLASENIDVTSVNPCTLTSADLHSHRRDGDKAGRLACFVWLQNPGAPPPTPHP